MKSNLIQTFFELVQIDSPSGHEEKLSKYLSTRMSEFGVKPDIDREGNILIKFPGNGEPAILSAHMDTVEPGKNVKPVVVGGIIKSSGNTILGADNKAALAAILVAVKNTQSVARRPLEIIFSVREETDGGINKFDFKKLKSRAGLIADSSTPVGTIITSSPWIQEIKVKIFGKAAHAGRPEDGINALKIVSQSLSKIKLGRVDRLTTSNFGLIKGGQATNTVPDNMLLEGEARSFSKLSLDKQVENMKRVLLTESKRLGGRAEFKDYLYCPGYVHEKRHLRDISIAVEKSGLKLRFEKTFGGSDANTFNYHGISVVNIGDGTKYSHTVREQMSVKSLMNLTKVIENYISL